MSNLFSVTGKTVVVTGGGSGIGRMISTGFARAGCRVFISSRKYEKCVKAAKEISAECKCGSCEALPSVDLGKGEKACEAFLAALKARGVTKLDVLVNNSGCSWGEPFEKYSEKGFDKVMNLNVKGLFFLTKVLAPLLAEAGTADSPARVINIGSIAGLRPQKVPTFAYDASKAAVHHLTRQMAGTLAVDNITVNAIAPGLVPSNMSKQVCNRFVRAFLF
jgi:NAD(P)-dependent dehydrogenase (short-subunit alcohol dehydrogenase family)